MLTRVQTNVLLKPIRPERVKKTEGNSYLEAWDVIAYLTKVFGFEGWTKDIIALDVIHETPGKSRDGTKDVWTVAYRCIMRLTIRDPQGNVVKEIDDASVGDAINQPSRSDAHDLALKSAISGALKRCAKDLGDQFGLGLYDNGSLKPCLGRVVLYEGERAGVEDDGATQAREVAAGIAQHRDLVENPQFVQDLEAAEPPVSEVITQAQRRKIFVTSKAKGVEAHMVADQILGREGLSLNDLTKADAGKVIDHLEQLPDVAAAS